MHSSQLLAESTETIIQQTNFLKEYLQLYQVSFYYMWDLLCSEMFCYTKSIDTRPPLSLDNRHGGL